MTSNKLFGAGLVVAALAITVIQFIPAPPLLVPAQLPPEQRVAHRLLNFEGIANFRDMGGYQNSQGQQVQWGKLYRSGNLAKTSRADLAGLQALELAVLVDFRSRVEKDEEPSHLPEPLEFTVVDIPILDGGNQSLVSNIMDRVESGDFEGFDPGESMLQANRQFANEFTPQFRQFVHTVLDANGAPVLFNCSAGKDRSGFAAAILLRILGVPQDTIMRDYMASREPALAARENQLMMLRMFKGDAAADKIAALMGVEEDWLEAGFEQIDATWGNFDNYVANGLQLSGADIQRLRDNLLR